MPQNRTPNETNSVSASAVATKREEVREVIATFLRDARGF